MSQAQLSWIQQIQSTLIDSGVIPLTGNTPHFPWKELSQEASKLLELPELKISPRKTAVLNSADILKGFESEPLCLSLLLTPLGAQAFWVMGKADVAQLTTLLLTTSQDVQTTRPLSSSKYQEGFYYFLATECIQILRNLQAVGDLSLTTLGPATPPEEDSLCIDVEIRLPKQTFWGRLICPASLHHSFKSHFSSKQPPLLTSAFAKQIDVTVCLELGTTQLSVSQWKNVTIGDFILLERCTFDPLTKKGNVTLTLEQTPLLRARIKDNHLKLIEYATYHEEEYPMDPEEENKEKEIESEELSSVEIEDEDSTEHLWSEKSDEIEKLVSTKEIPLTLRVEVARMQINLDKLLQLSPGNTLELPVRPESGVDVVINGKKVAKAELIKLGEMLGIKILQLGS